MHRPSLQRWFTQSAPLHLYHLLANRTHDNNLLGKNSPNTYCMLRFCVVPRQLTKLHITQFKLHASWPNIPFAWSNLCKVGRSVYHTSYRAWELVNLLGELIPVHTGKLVHSYHIQIYHQTHTAMQFKKKTCQAQWWIISKVIVDHRW